MHEFLSVELKQQLPQLRGEANIIVAKLLLSL